MFYNKQIQNKDSLFMSVHLEVRGLRRVVNSRVIFSDISFDLKSKEILCIRGPSGVGKTLLLRALACLDPIQVTLHSPILNPIIILNLISTGRHFKI